MWNRRILTASAVALLVGASAVVGATRAHAAGVTPVTACGTVISTPGSYALANNLGPCTGDGIDITTGGVTLDLQGFTIEGPGAATTFSGIAVPAPGTISVSIVSSTGAGKVIHFGTGVNVSGASSWGVVVKGIDASQNGDGIDILAAPKAPVVENDSANSDSGNGILVSLASGAVIANNHAENDTTGISVQSSLATQVTDNVVSGNSYGIVNSPAMIATVTAGEGTVAVGNVAVRSSVFDIDELAAGCIADVWLDNTFTTANQTCVM
jgi:parallel beta-helix repeat protein